MTTMSKAHCFFNSMTTVLQMMVQEWDSLTDVVMPTEDAEAWTEESQVIVSAETLEAIRG